MNHLSVNTFVRALSVPSDSDAPINLGKAAGDYENTPWTKVTKGVVGVLTLGIGYGIIWLIEHFGNVSPKIDEFRQAALDLYEELERTPTARGEGASVTIRVGNKTVTFSETAEGVEIKDESGRGLLERANLASVKDKLYKDFTDNVDVYARFRGPQNEANRPSSRVLQLSNEHHINMLSFDPKKESVKAFVKRFTEIGIKDPHWNRFLSFLFKRGDKKKLLEAIAYNQIATTPGGTEALEEMCLYRQPADSSTFLLAALDSKQRKRILLSPPELGENGQLVIKLDVKGQGAGVNKSVDLVLTKYCFSYNSNPDSGQLTRTEKLGPDWNKKNAAGENVFLRKLLDRAPTIDQYDERITDPLQCIMNMIMRADRDGDMGHIKNDEVNVGLCKTLASSYELEPRWSCGRVYEPFG